MLNYYMMYNMINEYEYKFCTIYNFWCPWIESKLFNKI